MGERCTKEEGRAEREWRRGRQGWAGQEQAENERQKKKRNKKKIRVVCVLTKG